MGWGGNRPLRAAGVRAHDHAVPHIEVLAYPAQRARLGVQVIDRDVEEALDLARV